MTIKAVQMIPAAAFAAGLLVLTSCSRPASPPPGPPTVEGETTPDGTEPVPADSAPPATAPGSAAPAPVEHHPAAPRPTQPTSGSTGANNASTSGAEDAAVGEPSLPAPRMLTLPAGKRMKIDLDGALSTATSKKGDSFSGTVNKTVHLDSGATIAVPKGARIEGTVSDVESAKRTKGTAKLELRFKTLVLSDGTRVPIVASMKSEAESTKKRDTATIAGSAVGGAILGALIGKDGKGAAIGAIAGGAIGTGVVLGTKGNEVEIPPGTEITIEMDEAISVPAPLAAG